MNNVQSNATDEYLLSNTIVEYLLNLPLDGIPRNHKFYRINDDGKLKYAYWMEEEANNANVHVNPISLSTFFLENSKDNLIPEGMTCGEFVNLSDDEKQAIVTNINMASREFHSPCKT